MPEKEDDSLEDDIWNFFNDKDDEAKGDGRLLKLTSEFVDPGVPHLKITG